MAIDDIGDCTYVGHIQRDENQLILNRFTDLHR